MLETLMFQRQDLNLGLMTYTQQRRVKLFE